MGEFRQHGSERGLMTTNKVMRTCCDHVLAACGEAYLKESRVRGHALSGGIGLLDVRPGKVDSSSGCESRPSKVGQPLGSKLWAGGRDAKG